MSEPLTIAAAAPLIRTGDLTPSELLEQCLSRIDLYEPAVQAWVYLDRERARRDAARLTDEAKAGRVRGPLHGVPVGVKDIIDVFDMPTGCGSKLWANSYARRDATVVEQVRQAGAVILGKTVTTPFAYLDPPPTRNPWDLNRTPGGSSSGSAAAVACGMCLTALGTQTGGSTIRPAAYCGIAALKPSHGRVSVTGVLPLAPTLDHVGLMARTAADLRTVYEVLASPSTATVDRLRFVRLRGLFDERVSSSVRASMDEAAARLTAAGHEVTSADPPGWLAELFSCNQAIYAYEAAGYHSERLDRRPSDYPPRIAGLVTEGEAVRPPAYSAAAGWRAERAGGDWLAQAVALTAAATDLPPSVETTGSPVVNTPWSFLGWPAATVPAGWADRLPTSVQLAAGSGREFELLAHAVAAERAFGFEHRLPPVPG